MPGPKILWQFEELGYDYSINTCSDGVTINEDCRTSAKPVRWDYRDDPNRYRIHEIISGLATLKTQHPDPFQTGNFNWDVGGYGKRLHLNGSAMNAVVVANFRVTNLSMIPGFQHTGTWYDYFTGTPLQVSDVSAFMDFAPGEYHVFVDQELDFPAHLDQEEVTEEAPIPFPNPTSGKLRWNVGSSNLLQKVTVFDAKGAMILENASFISLSDGQGVWVDLSRLPSGMYTLQAIGQRTVHSAHVHVVN